MQIKMPRQVKKAISILDENGFKAYIVGGCVRDSILGVEPDDFDLTTDASPDDMIKCFSDYRIIETGLMHGTVTVIIDHCPMEITTHRIDGEYSDNRRPDCVNFSKKLTDDLSRRDFTVNAMAYNDEIGLVDEFGSLDDLNRKIIRTVGNADKRFQEDALRIIRALRFASVLGFEIEEETSNAILRNKDLLRNIAVERICTEFNKLICGDCVDILLKYRDVFAVFMPEIIPTFDLNQNSKYHIYDVWEHIVRSVGFAPKDKIIRLAMLFHDIGKGRFDGKDGHFYKHAVYSEKMAYDIMKRLRYDNATTDEATRLVKYHDSIIDPSEKSVKRWLNRLDEKSFSRLIEIKRADNLAQAPEYHSRQNELVEIKKTLDKVIADEQCFKLKDLAVNGNDLKALGIPDLQIGKTLNRLLEFVIDNKLPNEKEALTQWIKKEKNTL